MKPAQDLMKNAMLLIDECKRLEPGSAEVCGDDISEMKVVYENTDFSVASSSQGSMLGLRVITKNRLGFITTNSTDPNELRELAREAQMIARLSPESEFHDIGPKQKPGQFKMQEDRLSRATPKDLLRWAELLVSASRKDPRVALDRAELSLQTNYRLVVNSNGVAQEVTQTTCSWYVMGMAKDGNEVTSFDYDGNSTSRWDEVDTKIEQTAKEFRESVLGSLGSTRAVRSYKGPVLFHPAAVGSLIAGVIGFNVNARGQQDGMSRWAGKLGELVASPLLNFSENPLDVSRPGDWTPFDREGVPTARHEIISNGRLNFTAHNMFTAKRAKTASTGNANGSSRSVPAIGLSGLTVAAGGSSQSDLYSGLNSGLVLKRFSGNSDPVSGQFSGVAKNSWWVENGKRTSSLKEVMIAGNMFDLLTNVKLVGSEIHRQGGSFDSPYLLIDGVSVTSG